MNKIPSPKYLFMFLSLNLVGETVKLVNFIGTQNLFIAVTFLESKMSAYLKEIAIEYYRVI